MTQPCLDVVLSEWQQRGPFPMAPELQAILAPGPQGPGLAALLGEKLKLSAGFAGLEIAATSYVGRVDVGPLRVTITPKIATTTLARMVRYVYGLTDIWRPGLDAEVSLSQHGLQDLLVELLLGEIERCWRSGLPKTYRPRADRVDTLRGRVDTGALARMGVLTEARLPCRYFERTVDWQLNQVILAGLRLARRICAQPELSRRAGQLAHVLDGVETLPALAHRDINRVRVGLTRLTENFGPALDLIELLLDGSGLTLEGSQRLESKAFLFDMNRFFQRFISRFLREYTVGLSVADERTISGLYRLPHDNSSSRRRRPPRARR